MHVQAYCLRSRFGANRSAAKDCRTVLTATVLNSRSPRAMLFGGHFILTNDYVGEFMRTLIAAMALVAMTGGAAVAAEQSPKADVPVNPSFSEDGIYIAPGENAEVTIAGECRRLTNSDERMGFYITPALHDAWPDTKDRVPLEPNVTEEPCK